MVSQPHNSEKRYIQEYMSNTNWIGRVKKKREEDTKLSGQNSWTEVNPGWAINLITKPKTINFFKEM